MKSFHPTIFFLLLIFSAQQITAQVNQVPGDPATVFAARSKSAKWNGKGGNMPSWKSVSGCLPDTMEYALEKASTMQNLSLNDSSSARSVGLYVDAPQAITIHGFTFHGWKNGTKGGTTMAIICEVYAAGADSNPTGGALAIDTVIVNTTGSGQPLNVSARHATFNPPVKISQPFVCLVSNYYPLDFSLVNSNWISADGAGEWLAPVNLSGFWYRPYDINIGGIPYNADPMIFPHVTFDLEASFISNPACLSSAGTVVFSNSTSGAVFNRFYNQNVFFNTQNNSHSWNYGDGSPLQSIVAGSHAFSTAGPYNITLFATVAGWRSSCPDTSTILLPASVPSAAFNSSSTLLVANFTSTSSGAVSYLWDFGDGNSDTLSNPVHTYLAVGTYSVCLTATNGCGNDSICKSVTITCPKPVSGFTFVVNGLTASFTNTSTSSNSNFWSFQSGGNDTASNPMKTWNIGGTYQVCLQTSNTCGSDTICQNVTVACAAPITNFTFSAVLTTVTYTNTSFSVTLPVWDFGDGSSSTQFSPVHTFPSAGTYTVCLIGTNTCGMGTDTTCKSVTVTCQIPTAGFQFTTGNLLVNFSDNSTGIAITGWNWDFGDGFTSGLQNPVHGFAAAGTYNVCLVTTNQCGPDTSCNNVTVSCAKPLASFTWTNNLTIANFTNTSQSTAGGFTSFSWTFGDGQTSTLENPQHNYTFIGIYTVCLMVSDTCGNDTLCDTVSLFPVQTIPVVWKDAIGLYPNPASDFIHLTIPDGFMDESYICIMEVTGNIIRKWAIPPAAGMDADLDISGISPGIYLFLLNQGSQMVMRKIMISVAE